MRRIVKEFAPAKAQNDQIQTSQPIQRQDLFYFIRITMWIAAMYPLPLQQYLPRFLRFIGIFFGLLYEVFLYFITIHIAILYAFTLYFSLQEANLEFQVNSLIQLIIYVWAIIMKFYFRYLQPNILEHLMETINGEYRTRSAEGLSYVTMTECLAMSNKWLNIYVYCCYGGTIFWLILPIAYGDHSLPLTCWYPFDYKEPIIYPTMYFFQIVGQVQVAAAFAGSSGFFMVLAILLSGQYDVLCCSLKNVIATAYIKLGVDNQQLRELEKLQQNSNAELNQYYCAIEHKDDWLENVETAVAATATQNASPQNFQEAFRFAFKDCVEHHRYILSLLTKMEKFYHFIWLLKNGEVILLMCLVAFVSVKSTTANSSFMKILSLGQYLILVIWELLIICYFGEVISQNSHRCGEAVLRSPWFLQMREMKKDFLFFLINSQRPFKLTAGKMYKLDLNRFHSVLTTAFSFLTILQKMDQRELKA